MINEICGFAYDCKNADTLADFYVELLGWKKEISGGGRQLYVLRKGGCSPFKK